MVTVNKLNNNLDLVHKIEGYIQLPADVLNKARFFDEGFAKSPVTAAKVILVVVDFNEKMEEILLDMRGLFKGLEAQQIPLDQLPNLFINTKELPMLQGWEARAARQTSTPTKPTQPQAKQLKKNQFANRNPN